MSANIVIWTGAIGYRIHRAHNRCKHTHNQYSIKQIKKMLHKVFHTFPSNYWSWDNRRLTTFESNLITSTFIFPARRRVHLLLIFFKWKTELREKDTIRLCSIQLLRIQYPTIQLTTDTHTTQLTIRLI